MRIRDWSSDVCSSDLFVATKGPQYANIDYTARYSKDVEDIFQGLPAYRSSWFSNGTYGTNNGFGGVILMEWSERDRSTDEIQPEINGKGAELTGVYATASDRKSPRLNYSQ